MLITETEEQCKHLLNRSLEDKQCFREEIKNPGNK